MNVIQCDACKQLLSAGDPPFEIEAEVRYDGNTLFRAQHVLHACSKPCVEKLLTQVAISVKGART